ncbi:hypothetical protein K469DRAFT_770346 [Zopfia rhizophila CBS 207.26]|uniref:Uncharacterized protein n=1 Tax=Zopfia rhizophila CBS 207.26 TaxID=1314779 RepID=A0A6A6D949_9PEZI|nr:hypothetical protein K469DRAFT_770346 [Zopfia rhizophila CBS 207.26]
MKRQNLSTPNEGKKKKQRLQEPGSNASYLKEIDSVREQAEPYRLVTAKFPIDALTPEWTVGLNRPIDEAHKQRLCEIYKEQGVFRKDSSYRLRVACTEDQVQKMMDHIGWEQAQNGHFAAARGREIQEKEFECPSFKDWNTIIGEKAELMAGNHRVEALKEYLRRLGCGDEERWWICDIYDKDTLPPHLHIKLRANREDLVLPDNHGQIWAELATLSSQDSTLFQGRNSVVEQQMIQLLNLSGRVKFPVRRLGTLWRNKNWRQMVTRWCGFSLGQATFNISTFEWMASCRIDDFWFTTFDRVISTISRIHSEFNIDIQSSDWVKLASLPQARKLEDVRKLFYPDQDAPSSLRRRDLFPTADDDTYNGLYQSVLSTPDLSFADVHSLLKTTKKEGKVMSVVVSHVGQWLNRDPARVIERDNNKPPLRNDFLPALRERYGEGAEKHSIELQERLLVYIRNNIDEFTRPIVEHYLHEYPSGNSDAYAERFEHEVWKDILILVVEFAGPHLQHESMLRFNTEDPRKISSKPASAITQAVCKLIGRIPEVSQNPALKEEKAMDDLCEMMQPVIIEWAARQCANALENGTGSPFRHLSSPMFRPVTLDKARGGNDVAVCDGRSSTHGSDREHTTTGSSGDRPTAGLDETGDSQPREPPQNPIDLTLEELQGIRTLHRKKRTLPSSPPTNGFLGSPKPIRAGHDLFGRTDGFLEREPTLSQSRDGTSDGESEGEGGSYGKGIPVEYAPECEDGSFGEDNQVMVASEQHSWKIDHAKGDHKLKVQDLIAKTDSPSFDGGQAIDMLQRLYTIDYGSRKAGSKPAAVDDKYLPAFFLDLLIVVGRPLKPITRPNDRFFDNITITFKNWRASYSSKHVHGLPFDLEHRTFRLATAATRESWYIVMHPIAITATELPSSRRERRKRLEKSARASALEPHHAHFLATYIKQVFLIGELLGEGIEPSWMLDGPHSQKITFNKWTTFQERFMQEWSSYVGEHACDTFWTENQPAFHAYDYGANIEIDVNEQLWSLPKETRLRAGDKESESDDENSDVDGSTQAETMSSQSPTRGESAVGGEVNYQALYTDGLGQLRTELEHKYALDNIDTISYALAVDINCLDAHSPDPDDKLAWCLLADRNIVLGEFQGPRDFTFYPLAFHPAYGNFSSPRPPAFLMDNLLIVMQENMSYQNNGAGVLSYGHVTAKRQRLLRCLLGQLTPEDPDSSRPFAREQRRIGAAISEEEFAFRMEQVLSVQVSRLVDGRRSFSTVLNPIFQLIRFYLKESRRYTHFLRSFRPSIFPGVLGSFARIFELAINDIHARFEATGCKELSVALAEGVSALDRLGSYCFTGFLRSLMGSVLGPLGTIDGIERGAWPYINPRMLDLQGGGGFSLAQWPRSENGRPLLMHVASIAFHYGQEAAASRHSNVWFKELGGVRVRGPSGATKFLEEVFQDLWMPQMVAFVTHQFNRALSKGGRSQEPSGRIQESLQLMERKRESVQRWSQSSHPFSWAEYEPVVSLFVPENTPLSTCLSTRTRRDFAQELYDSCIRSNESGHKSFTSQNATWFSVLRAAIRYTTTSLMSKELWVGALSVAMLSNGIECIPGSYQSRLSYRRVVRLVGSTPPALALTARPGSLKRAAIEAEHRAKRPANRKMVIDLGCAIPFTTIPQLVDKGFRLQEKNFKKGDGRVLEHYQVARQCLVQCLGDPLCDVMLMMVLTLASSSVTPFVAPKARDFEAGPRKDPAMFAANLVTRMLWFLRPQSFPWKADAGSVLRVPEMTKKIEHKGVSNRMLRELGWVEVVRGNRDSPRNSDLALRSTKDLHRKRKELLSLRKNAAGFIGSVFHSHDSIWVERCLDIIREK